VAMRNMRDIAGYQGIKAGLRGLRTVMMRIRWGKGRRPLPEGVKMVQLGHGMQGIKPDKGGLIRIKRDNVGLS
jgi:hypothetical protein